VSGPAGGFITMEDERDGLWLVFSIARAAKPPELDIFPGGRTMAWLPPEDRIKLSA
jgi:hypothetical protein